MQGALSISKWWISEDTACVSPLGVSLTGDRIICPWSLPLNHLCSTMLSKDSIFFGSSEPFKEKVTKYRLKFKNICGLQNPCKSKRKVSCCLTSLPVENYRRPNWERPLEETCDRCYDYCNNHFSRTRLLMETEPVMMLIKSSGCTCL